MDWWIAICGVVRLGKIYPRIWSAWSYDQAKHIHRYDLQRVRIGAYTGVTAKQYATPEVTLAHVNHKQIVPRVLFGIYTSITVKLYPRYGLAIILYAMYGKPYTGCSLAGATDLSVTQVKIRVISWEWSAMPWLYLSQNNFSGSIITKYLQFSRPWVTDPNFIFNWKLQFSAWSTLRERQTGALRI